MLFPVNSTCTYEQFPSIVAGLMRIFLTWYSNITCIGCDNMIHIIIQFCAKKVRSNIMYKYIFSTQHLFSSFSSYSYYIYLKINNWIIQTCKLCKILIHFFFKKIAKIELLIKLNKWEDISHLRQT